MKKSSFAIHLLAVLALVVGAVPATQQAAKWTPEEQMKVKAVGSAQPSPDGDWVAFTVNEPVMTDDTSEYRTHIWVARADGSEAHQYTRGEKSAANPQWSPDGKWIAFTSSRSGKNNLWRIRLAGGEAEQLTDVKSGVGSFAWSPDGNWVAFTMTDPPTEQEEKDKKKKDDAQVVDEDFKYSRLYVVRVQTDAEGKREPRKLTGMNIHVGGGFLGGFAWSPDGKRIVFSHTPTPLINDWTNSDISIVDVASGEITALAATAAAETQPLFSPDGKWIAYTASDIPVSWGFTSHVYVVPAAGGNPRKLAATPDEQPGLVGWSADGRVLYFSETWGTLTRLGALPTDGSQPRWVDTGEQTLGSLSVNRAATHVGFVAQRSDEPAEAYVTRLDGWAPVRVSRANAEIPRHMLGRTEVIRWKSKDGMEIEGLLTYPANYQAGRRVPLLVIVHGGPTGVFTQSFIANRSVYPIASFASEGYAVLRCNVRGSSGYGRKFRYANYNDWGGGDFQDIMSGVDYVIEMGVADPERLGIMGWSYGGFMTSWTITQTHRFQAASVGAGVTNLMSFTGTADIPGFIPDYFGTEFWDNLEPYRKHSAMFNVKGVATPTLIQHGERDLRVPLGQGQELYNALKRQGVTVKMVVYPREPHGLSEPRHVLDAGRRNLDWFGKYLLGQ